MYESCPETLPTQLYCKDITLSNRIHYWSHSFLVPSLSCWTGAKLLDKIRHGVCSWSCGTTCCMLAGTGFELPVLLTVFPPRILVQMCCASSVPELCATRFPDNLASVELRVLLRKSQNCPHSGFLFPRWLESLFGCIVSSTSQADAVVLQLHLLLHFLCCHLMITHVKYNTN